ncbi:hypothetical protein HK102_001087 [Quaeritorhiza haematococci]|nr:hypothetical protein HK102_001087 [Quaeritorhiza haematococci]
MATEGDQLFDAFVATHAQQLADVPEKLWRDLFAKLTTETFGRLRISYLCFASSLQALPKHISLLSKDAGSSFVFDENHNLVYINEEKPMEAESTVFLVDHMWSFGLRQARQDLSTIPHLLEKIEAVIASAPKGGDDDEEEKKEADESWEDQMVKSVVEQTGVSEEKAKAALEEHNYELINAIMSLTLEEEESDVLAGIKTQIGMSLDQKKPKKKEEKPNKEEQPSVPKPKTKTERINAVLNAMWRLANVYNLTWLGEDDQPRTTNVWYIMDQVGTAISHSDDPTVRLIPFLYYSNNAGAAGPLPLCVFWPVKELEYGDVCTRDVAPTALKEEAERTAYLAAIVGGQQRENAVVESWKAARAQVTAHAASYTPSFEKTSVETQPLSSATDSPITVYTDIPTVRASLQKDPHVRIVDDVKEEEVDLVWATNIANPTSRSKRLMSLREMLDLDQIHEAILKTYGNVDWFPATYSVRKLTSFVGDFLDRQTTGADNAWIVKTGSAPARSIPTIITESVAQVSKLVDLSPTEKELIVQKCLLQPALYGDRKFSLDFTVLLTTAEKSVNTGGAVVASLGTHNIVAFVHEPSLVTKLAQKPYPKADAHDHVYDDGVHLPTLQRDASQKPVPTRDIAVKNLENMLKASNASWQDVQVKVTTVIRGECLG